MRLDWCCPAGQDLEMDKSPNPGTAIGGSEEVFAAFDWWRDAGVDYDFSDAPNNWLSAETLPTAGSQSSSADAVRQGSPAIPPQMDATDSPVGPQFDLATIPNDLQAFSEWWMQEPLLDNGRVTGRIPPRGVANSDLMILVAQPEKDDHDVLLAGSQGRLLEAMCQSMGLPLGQCYLASVLPRHTPQADWRALSALGMAAVIQRHVTLVTPRRLLVFGSNVLPLLSHDPAKTPVESPYFNHEAGSVPLMTEVDLATFLDRPGGKSRFWARWLDWTA